MISRFFLAVAVSCASLLTPLLPAACPFIAQAFSSDASSKLDAVHENEFNLSDISDKLPLSLRHFSHSREFDNCLDHKVTLHITMTIPDMIGIVPVGGNLDVTSFAIGPNGDIFLGDPINIVPAPAFEQALDPVVIRHPVRGNYVIGYFITPGTNSPVFPLNTIANFSGVVLNNVVEANRQSVTFPVQTLFLGVLENKADLLIVTGNFPIGLNFCEDL